MLSNMTGNNLAMLRVRMCQNILNEIIAVLVTSNVDKGNAWSIRTALADTVKIAAQKINTANLETLLNDLGGKLIHAVFRSISDNMVNGTAAISWCTMLANMLNAPIAKLAVSNDINAGQYLLDTWTL
jgi:hypothetical protein